MGRNKIKIEKITNLRMRMITFDKRKKGLLKKAMELSILCQQEIFLSFIDRSNKCVVYHSLKDSHNYINNYILNIDYPKRILCDLNYENLDSENDSQIYFKEERSQECNNPIEDYLGSKRKNIKESLSADATLKIDHQIVLTLGMGYSQTSLADSRAEKISKQGLRSINHKLSLKVNIPGKSTNLEPQPNFNKSNDIEVDQTNLALPHEKFVEKNPFKIFNVDYTLVSPYSNSGNMKYGLAPNSLIRNLITDQISSSTSKYFFPKPIISTPKEYYEKLLNSGITPSSREFALNNANLKAKQALPININSDKPESESPCIKTNSLNTASSFKLFSCDDIMTRSSNNYGSSNSFLSNKFPSLTYTNANFKDDSSSKQNNFNLEKTESSN